MMTASLQNMEVCSPQHYTWWGTSYPYNYVLYDVLLSKILTHVTQVSYYNVNFHSILFYLFVIVLALLLFRKYGVQQISPTSFTIKTLRQCFSYGVCSYLHNFLFLSQHLSVCSLLHRFLARIPVHVDEWPLLYFWWFTLTM